MLQFSLAVKLYYEVGTAAERRALVQSGVALALHRRPRLTWQPAAPPPAVVRLEPPRPRRPGVGGRGRGRGRRAGGVRAEAVSCSAMHAAEAGEHAGWEESTATAAAIAASSCLRAHDPALAVAVPGGDGAGGRGAGPSSRPWWRPSSRPRSPLAVDGALRVGGGSAVGPGAGSMGRGDVHPGARHMPRAASSSTRSWPDRPVGPSARALRTRLRTRRRSTGRRSRTGHARRRLPRSPYPTPSHRDPCAVPLPPAGSRPVARWASPRPSTARWPSRTRRWATSPWPPSSADSAAPTGARRLPPVARRPPAAVGFWGPISRQAPRWPTSRASSCTSARCSGPRNDSA